MNRFEKRTTAREVEIGDDKFSVDFGRDDIRFILWKIAEDMKSVPKSIQKGLSPQEEYDAVVEGTKKVYKSGINEIIGDDNASETIFKDDDTMLMHEDVYKFLVEKFYEVIGEESPYSPKRIK